MDGEALGLNLHHCHYNATIQSQCNFAQFTITYVTNRVYSKHFDSVLAVQLLIVLLSFKCVHHGSVPDDKTVLNRFNFDQ